jgi:hypothetical protein
MPMVKRFQYLKLSSKTAVTLNTKIASLYVLLLLNVHNIFFAQGSFELGILPAVNFNKKLKNDWSLNSRIESRMLLQSGVIKGAVDRSYNYVLTDFSLIAAKKVGLNSRVAAGYLIRFEEGDVHHRFIQQYTIVQRFSAFRLAHRAVSDQTFSSVEAPEFRLRYRITTELPLNGESADPGELYLKINNEYLNSIQARDYDLEIRVVPLLGYEFTEKLRLETGLDYRVDSFLNAKASHTYWMTVNFFMEF